MFFFFDRLCRRFSLTFYIVVFHDLPMTYDRQRCCYIHRKILFLLHESCVNKSLLDETFLLIIRPTMSSFVFILIEEFSPPWILLDKRLILEVTSSTMIVNSYIYFISLLYMYSRRLVYFCDSSWISSVAVSLNKRNASHFSQ